MLSVGSDEIRDQTTRQRVDLVRVHSLDASTEQAHLAIALIVVRRCEPTTVPLVVVDLDVEANGGITEIGMDLPTVGQRDLDLCLQMHA